MNTKTKRFIALLGAILLLLLYGSTLLFSILDTAISQTLLNVSIAATILLPVLLYIYKLFLQFFHENSSES